MGTDIRGVFQRRNPETKQWEDIPHKYEMDRHYQLFGVLAGVRNGRGFAGIKTGEPVEPISAPRGYPDGFQQDEDMHPIGTLDVMDPRRRQYHGKDEPMEVWMGDHSHSWLTGEEMLAWYERAPVVIKTGILSRGEYDAWDKKSPPESYCGGISGPGVVIIDDNAVARASTPGWTYIRCEWESNLLSELAYFFDEVKRLVAEHGEVRFVFGFDS